MLVSLNWVQEFVDLSDLSPHVIAETLSRTGLEVEGMKNYSSGLSKLVVAFVEACRDHPDSDHLKLTQVDVGETETYPIVCGAPNIAAGQKVIVALPGASLPGGIQIQDRKVRGQLSRGMICSLEELGIPNHLLAKSHAEGIQVLPEDAPVGEDAISYLGLDDTVLELDLTPNRADALSLLGVAQELSAVFDRPLKAPSIPSMNRTPSKRMDAIQVDILDASYADLYSLRLVEDVKVGDSPIDIQMKLIKSGIRPINNIVDITNYILILYGQPLHAFDLDKLPSPAIAVGTSEAGQVFTSLDGLERRLKEEDLVILSGGQAQALAGVMGGQDSEVTASTKNVLIEAAVFNPERVRVTSKRLNLRSESSLRFEKGVNLAGVHPAGDHAGALMAQLAGGHFAEGYALDQLRQAEDQHVTVALAAIPEKIGIHLTQLEIQQVMDRLGFQVTFHDGSFTVTVPSRRNDIRIEADILEEIARIHGYDKIPATRLRGTVMAGQLNSSQSLERQTRHILAGFGLSEFISYALTTESRAQQFALRQGELISLARPLSSDRTTLRQSLFPTLWEAAQYNLARQQGQLAIYELGRIFFGQGSGTLPLEENHLAVMLTGMAQEKTWYGPSRPFDFYDIKGIFEGYFEAIHVEDRIQYTASSSQDFFHPGRQLKIMLEGEDLGWLGQVHPGLAEDLDLEGELYYGEINLSCLIPWTQTVISQTPIPKYPSSSRDIALLVDRSQSHQSLVDTILQAGGPALQDLKIFDWYAGEAIAEDKKSMAYHLTFTDPQGTLTDDQVDRLMTDIQAALEMIPGLSIR